MACRAVKGREEFAKAKQNTSKLRLFLSVCCMCRVVVLLNKPIAILTTSLRSPSLMLKLPLVSGALRNATRQNRLQGRQLKLGQKQFLVIYLFIYLFLYSFLSVVYDCKTYLVAPCLKKFPLRVKWIYSRTKKEKYWKY